MQTTLQTWKADFFKELSDAAIQKHLEHASLLPTWQSTMHLYPVDGAAHKVGNSETPFSYRDATWSEVIVGVDPDPANNARITSWAKEYYDALHPYGAGGAYVNFMMEEGEDRIRATYRGNYDRLSSIKAKYDPNNFYMTQTDGKQLGPIHCTGDNDELNRKFGEAQSYLVGTTRKGGTRQVQRPRRNTTPV